MGNHKGLSLHIGVNEVSGDHYGGWTGPLAACEADATDMTSIAKANGYTPTTLLTRHATRKAVIDGIKDAADKLGAGDMFFLTYSGHGGQVPDMADEEADGQDETWCLFDGQLVDDELYNLWKNFAAGVRVLILSDSCHSGTVSKTAFDAFASGSLAAAGAAAQLGVDAPRYRYMPDPVAARTYRNNQAFYEKIQAEIAAAVGEVKASVRLISGCQDNQLSLDGTFNGLFTGMLLKTWKNGAFKGSYDDFHKKILGRMPSTQTPNHFQVGVRSSEYDAQQPFLIG